MIPRFGRGALSAAREWRALLPAADLVVADVLAAAVVRTARPRSLLEIRLLAPECLERLRPLLAGPAEAMVGAAADTTDDPPG